MTNKITIETIFGTLDEQQIADLGENIKDMSEIMSKIDLHRSSLKEKVNALHDELKIPKKIINRMAKVYHKNTFTEIVTEDQEFEALYTTVVKQP